MNRLIIPSVIARTQEELDRVLSKVQDIASLFQLDVMDGRFVPNHSLDFDFKLPRIKCEYEAQLMVENPEKWVKKNGEKVHTIIAQIESVKNPESFIEYVKNNQKRVGFALKPETDIVQIQDYLESIDQVLVMTVHPGFYGGEFLPSTLDKVKRLRDLMPELDIEVDGGIQPHTLEMAMKAGANLFVSGSYLITAENNEERVKRMNMLKNLVQEN
jgi:ribulose-phosphate 3-epimerase